jgi:hypothetical protein
VQVAGPGLAVYIGKNRRKDQTRIPGSLFVAQARLRNGKLLRGEVYLDQREALEAAGVSE